MSIHMSKNSYMKVHNSFMYNNQNRTQPECPSSEQISKMDMDTVEYCTAIKKNELLIHAATWIILKIIMLSSGSKTKKHFLYDLINIKFQEM